MLKKIGKEKLFYIVLSFLIFSILSVLFFIRVKFSAFPVAIDTQFHLRRALELKESIEHGNFLPEFSFNFFHGVSIMSMYPYLSLYPFVLILFIVPSLIRSYYIFFVLITFITLLTCFVSSLRYSKSTLISYLFATSYGLSSTFLFQFFATGDLGIVTSLSVLPLAIFGFIDLLNNSKNYFKLSFGLSLLLFCQLPLFLITAGFLIVWGIINFDKLTKKIICLFFKSIILNTLLTSIVWIPIIYTSLSTKICSVELTRTLHTEFMPFFENLGILAPFVIILSLFYFKRFNKIDKQMLILSLIICFMATKYMPWNIIEYIPIIKLINYFQFSYRFLIIPLILLCYLFSRCVSLTIQLHHIKKTLVIFSLIFILLLQFSAQLLEIHRKFNVIRPITNIQMTKDNSLHDYTLINNKSIYCIVHGYFHNNDYYPKRAIPVKNQIFNNNICSNKGYRLNLWQIKYNKFKFYNKYSSKFLILPFVHYNNESLKLYINNHQYPINITKYGLISIRNISSGYKVLNIKYIPNNKIEILRHILFILGILWCILSLIFTRETRKVK